MEELVSRVFAARDITHIEHLRTKSYAAHIALGEFYDGVIVAVDAAVEAYQGLFGQIEIELHQAKYDSLIEYLQEEADWIDSNRVELSGGNDAIANMIDAITGLYLTTIYKLQTFK